MEIIIRDEGTPRVIALKGRLDTNTAPELETFANDLFASGVMDLIVDMADIDYVSSAGLRVIVGMQKKVLDNGSLVFQNVQPEVMEVFDMTGFSQILTFE